jgi:alpha-mannosidase
VDLSSPDEGLGVSILTDSHYGWDKPDDSTLRLSLLRSPRVVRKFRHQGRQDHGRHRFVYALFGHRGSWQESGTAWQAARLNQPPLAFRVYPSPGSLGKSFSFAQTSTAQIAVTALKKSEDGDQMVVRVQETEGRELRGAELTFAAPIRQASEVDGMERRKGEAALRQGKLIADFGPYQPRAFALRLEPSREELGPAPSAAVEIPFDVVATSFHTPHAEGDFDGQGNTFPGELFPSRLACGGIAYRLGPAQAGAANAVACRGQRVDLPIGDFRTVHFLAASVDGDRSGVFRVGDRSTELRIQHYSGFVGRWKRWRRAMLGWTWSRPGTGFLKRDPIAWLATHRHARGVRDQPYVFCYLFRYVLDLPPGASSLELPHEPRIRLFALSLGQQEIGAATPANELYDSSTS